MFELKERTVKNRHFQMQIFSSSLHDKNHSQKMLIWNSIWQLRRIRKLYRLITWIWNFGNPDLNLDFDEIFICWGFGLINYVNFGLNDLILIFSSSKKKKNEELIEIHFFFVAKMYLLALDGLLAFACGVILVEFDLLTSQRRSD